MLVDELHERGAGRSSSAAKKAEAVFKIAFAPAQSILRRSSATAISRKIVVDQRSEPGVHRPTRSARAHQPRPDQRPGPELVERMLK
jgi:hypothetical protein